MCIDQYVKLVYGKGYNGQTIAEGTVVKNQNMPSLLFKYRKATDEHIESLANDFLYSAQLSALNDPFELALKLSSEDIYINMHDKILQNIRQDYPLIPEQSVRDSEEYFVNLALATGVDRNVITNDIKNDPVMSQMYSVFTSLFDIMNVKALKDILECAKTMYNICSLSETNESSTMWSYYSDGHTGFCMGYDIKSLANDIADLTLPIIYTNDYITVKDIEEIDGNSCMYAMTAKSLDWQHEKEWRIFYPPNPPTHKENMPVPKVVYLGCRMTDENKKRITKICADKGIEVVQKDYTNHHYLK